ncbi:MAG: hypothetical protein E7H06_22130, partial [Enterobacter asburiae]|nr:hypothetical protein [Enterobacter asburiae]
IGEGELMAHDVPLGCAPDEYDDLISGTCSHLPLEHPYFLFVVLIYCQPRLRVISTEETIKHLRRECD